MRKKHSLAAVIAIAVLVAGGTTAAAGTTADGATTAAPDTTGAPDTTASEAGATIKIGVAGSLSGATAFYGTEAANGVAVAVDELNAAGPHTYEMVAADDECTPEGGVAAFGTLIDVEQVTVIIGSPCSGAALAGMPLASEGAVPMVVASATNPQISEQSGVGGNEYTWRMNIGDGEMAEVFAAYIADAGYSDVATIAVNNDYGRGGVGAYAAQFAEVGINHAAEEYYTQGSGEFRSQLTNIGASGADAMLIIGAHQDGVVLLRQFAELGLDIAVFARGDLVSQGFRDLAGDDTLGEGLLEANNWDSTYAATPEFAEAYRAMFDHDPLSYAAQAYLATHVVAQAVEAGGPDREGINAGLAEVSWDSPYGPIEFDDNHQAHHDMFLLGFVNGEIELVERIPVS
ncbi:MAG: ABC transporter substrate-binding protein [Acidimicrobiales bacterium]